LKEEEPEEASPKLQAFPVKTSDEQAGQGVIEENTERGEICRTLSKDLEAIDPWLLPLEGGSAREGRPALQMQSSQ
jgi:hypothetical protein